MMIHISSYFTYLAMVWSHCSRISEGPLYSCSKSPSYSQHFRISVNLNLWCHQEECAGTYQPYRINIWGLKKTDQNWDESRLMLPQQVTNILRHLEKVHNIPKHEVVLPWGTSPFQGKKNLWISLA